MIIRRLGPDAVFHRALTPSWAYRLGGALRLNQWLSQIPPEVQRRYGPPTDYGRGRRVPNRTGPGFAVVDSWRGVVAA